MWWRFDVKLRTKITVVTLLSAMGLMALMAVVYLKFSYDEELGNTKSKLITYSKDIAYHIEKELLKDLEIVKTLQSAYMVKSYLYESDNAYAGLSLKEREKKLIMLNKKWMQTTNPEDPFIKKYTDNLLAKYLKKQEAILPGFYGEIFITNRYGAVVASTSKLTTFEHNQKYWWQECYANGKGKVFFDDRGYDDSVKGYVLGIVVPIKDRGNIIGIIKANIKVTALLKDAIDEYSKINFVKAKVVRTKGLIVYEEGVIPLSQRVPLSVVKRLKTLKSGSLELNSNGKRYLVGYSPIKLSLRSKGIVFGGSKASMDHKLGNDGEIWHVLAGINERIIFDGVVKHTLKIFAIGVLFTVIMLLYLFYLISKISKPLVELSEAVKEIGKGEWGIELNPQSDDEIGELTKSFMDMLENLKKTTASKKELEKEIQERIKAQGELKKKDKLLLLHAREAAMGEMMGMIAHQWRQPISVMSMAVNNLLVEIELRELKEESARECAKDVLYETSYLSQTIDDFRNFFKPDKEKELIKIKDVFDKSLKIIGKTLENNDIQVDLSGDLDTKVYTYANELSQVFINLFSNTKDAFLENNIKDRYIKAEVKSDKNSIHIEICDNAGGVKDDVMDKIFEPYFSTKNEKNGTGIGLYMCRMIIQKHNQGKIYAKNVKDGVCFVIELPLSEDKRSEK